MNNSFVPHFVLVVDAFNRETDDNVAHFLAEIAKKFDYYELTIFVAEITISEPTILKMPNVTLNILRNKVRQQHLLEYSIQRTLGDCIVFLPFTLAPELAHRLLKEITKVMSAGKPIAYTPKPRILQKFDEKICLIIPRKSFRIFENNGPGYLELTKHASQSNLNILHHGYYKIYYKDVYKNILRSLIFSNRAFVLLYIILFITLIADLMSFEVVIFFMISITGIALNVKLSAVLEVGMTDDDIIESVKSNISSRFNFSLVSEISAYD